MRKKIARPVSSCVTSIRIGRRRRRRRRREGGPGIKWPKEGERRGEEGDKLPIKWVSGIWDAIAYRVRALISDLNAAQLIGNTKHPTPTLEIMLKEISLVLITNFDIQTINE